MLAMLGTRPNLYYSISFFSTFQNCPTETLFNYLLRVLKYTWTIRYQSLAYHTGKEDGLKLYVNAGPTVLKQGGQFAECVVF